MTPLAPTPLLALRVHALRAEARDVLSIELRSTDGAALPPFRPGAHLEITLPAGTDGRAALVRHYSLCNSAAETHRYVVAVGLAPASRGGSLAVHEQLRVGQVLQMRPPRNHFALAEGAAHYRFIAGGIGITPIVSMLRWCEAHGQPWSLLYCTRSRVRTAFYEELRAYGPRVQFHFDDEVEGRHVDLTQAFAPAADGEHIYCCGPAPLMRAVQAASAERPPGTVHFEWFSAGESAPIAPADTERGFDIVLAQSGQRLHVPPDQSILDTLELHGMAVPFACREGLCRTCETGLCSGEADHRDLVLSDAERAGQKTILLCVSRAKSAVLELQL
ncbi:MAG: PDR/VanB family oxidoreductase [Acidovorax sp.]